MAVQPPLPPLAARATTSNARQKAHTIRLFVLDSAAPLTPCVRRLCNCSLHHRHCHQGQCAAEGAPAGAEARAEDAVEGEAGAAVAGEFDQSWKGC